MTSTIDHKIFNTQSSLSQFLLDTQNELTALFNEKRSLEEQAQWARAEHAPIRKVPAELLRDVFLRVFEDDHRGSAGWLFAAVCRRWRSLALETPRLWTRIRLTTRLDHSADVIRLWLERSGPSMSLDIQIFLRVPQAKAAIPAECSSAVLSPVAARRARRRIPGTLSDDGTYSIPIGSASEAWGHVAVFYLKQQLPRWKRFIFRYERVFGSLSAFRTIVDSAPILQEFEISCIEPGFLNYADWSWNAPGFSFPALRRLALNNTTASLSSSFFSQPLRSISLCGLPTNPIQVSALMQTLASHTSTLTSLSLFLPVLLPPVVPATAFPYTNVTPLCLPVLRELSLGGHYLMAQLLGAITAPSLEELNVDIDLGRGAFGHGIIGGNANYIEDIIQDFLNRGSPAPADKLRALSIGFGFGNGRRATEERENDDYLQSLMAAQACICAGTTFVPPHLPSVPSTSFTPSVVQFSWALLGNLSALESLKVGLGGHAGPAWNPHGHVPYQGSSSDVMAFLNTLCVPDEDSITGMASLGLGGPGGNGNLITFTVGMMPPPPPPPIPLAANPTPGTITVPPIHVHAAPPAQSMMNGNPNLPNINVHTGLHQAVFGAGGLPPLSMLAPPGAGPVGYVPPAPLPNFGMAGGGVGIFPGNGVNGWVLPSLLELGIKVGTSSFLPHSSSSSNGISSPYHHNIYHTSSGYNHFTLGGLHHHHHPPAPPTLLPPYVNPSTTSSSSFISLDDAQPGAGNVRRLLDLIDGRNPKVGRGPSVEGVVPERLKRVEVVLNVAGAPGRMSAHAVNLLQSSSSLKRKKEEGAVMSEGDGQGKGKGKNIGKEKDLKGSEVALEVSISNGGTENVAKLQAQARIQEIVDAISAVASGSAYTAESSKKDKESKTDNRPSNPATARALFGTDSISWIQERVEDADVRCECLLWEGPGMGLGRW
ncbi:hypothetical protein D9757_007595 [Collybiopsis confluens]|uniref:F-box domain-containing protein n=1 Tax=Collybiopsis confluens TaxID=2823264 RepID=A0A8H5M5Y3_9AGAR|nr:hypothetical protein D9757_007595 [Collybiopsis confluens]